MLRLTYDKSVDAAYLYFRAIGPGEVDKIHTCDTQGLAAGMINLNFDKHATLLGIESLEASKTLPKEILDKADIIG